MFTIFTEDIRFINFWNFEKVIKIIKLLLFIIHCYNNLISNLIEQENV